MRRLVLRCESGEHAYTEIVEHPERFHPDWNRVPDDLSASWPGLSGPPIPARAAVRGPDKPGHDGRGRPHVSSHPESALVPRWRDRARRRRLNRLPAGAARLARHREVKDGPPRHIRARPHSTAVRFDDRPADRQPQPQTVRLGRVEGLEQPLESRRRQARTQIPHRDTRFPDPAVPVLISNSRSPSRTPPMASTALMIKFRFTCCSCTRSP